VTQVRGYAAMQLRKPDAPLDPSNRRISLIVHYLDTGTSGSGQGQSANAAALSANLPGATPAPK
jgi:chemotaxis protein MotB